MEERMYNHKETEKEIEELKKQIEAMRVRISELEDIVSAMKNLLNLSDENIKMAIRQEKFIDMFNNIFTDKTINDCSGDYLFGIDKLLYEEDENSEGENEDIEKIFQQFKDDIKNMRKNVDKKDNKSDQDR